mmetsp:Transcript_20292/g.48099  ORF Transcript_20292/g.48099 Transcript_20292/m.48099 type:complete len:543 (-) Transcript_20292:109-1737(-)
MFAMLRLICLTASLRAVLSMRTSDNQKARPAVECQEGNTAQVGCKSVCRWLNLTTDTTNGQCDQYVERRLKGRGYSKQSTLKFWGHASSMEPIVKVLSTNCLEKELDVYLAALIQLVERMEPKKKDKYREDLDELEKHVTERLAPDVLAKEDDFADDGTPLPACPRDFAVEAGDILSFEQGGPDFAEISSVISDFAANSDALKLQMHFSYGAHFSYENTFNTSTDVEWKNRSIAGKAKRIFELIWKHSANTAVKVGKIFADAGINLGKGVVDLLWNIGLVFGKFFTWTGAGITSVYGSQRQTTKHTGAVHFTHTELGVDRNQLMSAYSDAGVMGSRLCSDYRNKPVRAGKIIISRFVGDGTINARNYRSLTASRAQMWKPYLQHYADTVGQWHRVAVGKCLSIFGTPGQNDYFQAVTDEKVREMWDYVDTPENAESGFYEGIKDSFRTHKDVENATVRVKPKAMFCSKFAAAVWSSTIGNPTAQPAATPRAADLKKMLPFNPGACSPWTIAQWLTSASGRKYWRSCLADASNETAWNPCEAR